MAFGALLTGGVQNYQVLQQREGWALARLIGVCEPGEAKGELAVYARALREEDGAHVTEWTPIACGTRDCGARDCGTRDCAPGDRDPGACGPGDRDPGACGPGDRDPGDRDPGACGPGDRDPGDRAPGDRDPGACDPRDRDPGACDPRDRDPGACDPRDCDPGDHGPGACGTRAFDGALRLPLGGPYRIETCLAVGAGAQPGGMRGDIVHNVCVGDVYIIAGQSNAAGYGRDPAYDPPEPGVHLFANDGKWKLATHPLNDATGTIYPENTEGGNPGHSSMLMFAKHLRRELGYPIGLLQASLGGSPISSWHPEEQAVLYKSMLRRLADAGGRVRGILWYQGCTEALSQQGAGYYDRFCGMIARWREQLGPLPVLTVQLGRFIGVWGSTDADWGLVRDAQRRAARDLPGVSVVPAGDLTLSDAIHISASGNLTLGARLARAALRDIYGRGGPKAPEVARVTRDGENALCVRFDNVAGNLLPMREVAPFTFDVEDEGGLCACTGMAAAAPDTLRLTFARPIGQSARLHGAWRGDSLADPPLDTASYLPMLGFYGVPVE